jgi:class 3 adenylate cyclase
MHPERVRSVILVHARFKYPEFRQLSPDQRIKLARRLATVDALRSQNPRSAHDPVLRNWWGRARRLLNSPEPTAQSIELAARLDAEAAASAMRVPTLVLHRRDNQTWDIEAGRAAAACIPNARFVELPGSETDIFLGDTAPALAEIEEFLRDDSPNRADDRPLATVLFTDIVASTEQLAAQGDNAWRHLLDDHDKRAGRVVGEYRGRIVRSTGDGILATFDGPARAVRCATALIAAAEQQGIALRAGLHTGEVELRPPDIAGIAVHTASRIADLAGPNEILVSRTVVDLTAGAGLHFDSRGEHQLKGVPGTWNLYAVKPQNDAP